LLNFILFFFQTGIILVLMSDIYFFKINEKLLGGSWDLQNSLSKMPGLPWSKYKGEKHFPGYSYLGPTTRTDIRLDKYFKPKSGEKPIDAIDNLALNHNVDYLLAESVEDKNTADKEMLEELKSVVPKSRREKTAKWLAMKALKLKLKLGVGLDLNEEKLLQDTISLMLVKGNGMVRVPRNSSGVQVLSKNKSFSPADAKLIAEELHKPIIRKFPTRKVIIKHLDEIWAMDLAEYASRASSDFKFLLIIIDCWSKYLWVEGLKNKMGDSVKTAIVKIIKNNLVKNSKMNYDKTNSLKNIKGIILKFWVDDGKEFWNTNVKSYLKDNNIVIYSTKNEGKSVIAERVIRTIKAKLEVIVEEQELRGL